MSILYIRRFALTLGATRIDGLDVDFKIVKSTKREPNTASLTVYNLSETHRRELEAVQTLRVQFEAGYDSTGLSMLFRGDLRTGESPRGGRKLSTEVDASDVKTLIEATDGGQTVLVRRVNRSFPPGTSVATVLGAAIDAAGIGRGNLQDFASQPLEGASATFVNGTVLYGWASEEIDQIVRSMGLRWSVQNGNFQGLVRGRPLQTSAVRLSPTTGLVGSPEVDEKGNVKATALIQPGLDPGRKILLESRKLTGGYEVKRVEYSGSTYSGDYYANLELKAY